MSNITGKCATCGCTFDVLLGIRCPNCRLQAVQKAFAPIDSLRTALGIHGLSEDAELDGVWHWHGGNRVVRTVESSEVPRGCKIPQGEEAQIYYLKRLFRL